MNPPARAVGDNVSMRLAAGAKDSGGRPLEVAVLVGLQASGTSTFTRGFFGDSHVVVSKDDWPNARNRQRRQMRLIAEALAAGRSVVVDNTNPSPAEWVPLIAEARIHGARTVGYWFPPDVSGSLTRNAVREPKTRVPEVGVRATLGRLVRPRRSAGPDGFDAVYVVTFDGAGGFTVHADDEG
jgi:predicted kinase